MDTFCFKSVISMLRISFVFEATQIHNGLICKIGHLLRSKLKDRKMYVCITISWGCMTPIERLTVNKIL
jgi:hypothetical protein